MTVKVGFLGPEGTFTEAAAKSVLPDSERIPFSTIPACMAAAAEEKVDIAVVPVENAIEGSVNMTLDYLIHKHDLPIVGEVTVPIEQHLLIHPSRKADWKDVTDIYSHPQAVAQCHEFIINHLPEADIHYTNSTSAAARELADNPSMNGVAIANALAAEKYGLTIVKDNIHDYSNNHTRFVLLSYKDVTQHLTTKSQSANKTTMMITLPSDYSGALHQVLSAFAWRKLNLTKIESRPMKTGIGNYFFIIDVEQEWDDVLIPGVIAEVEALGCGARILGSYPCFQTAELPIKKPILE
ncbi:prephenate dehydratase [Bacillus piscicola]|uniref:prephenate dehydratase n=1 Tax=Bacillus piscicola TaxID=1632684 RepID=UPI001F08F512